MCQIIGWTTGSRLHFCCQILGRSIWVSWWCWCCAVPSQLLPKDHQQRAHITSQKKSSQSSSSTDTDVDCRKTRSTHTLFDTGMCLYCQSDRGDEQLHDYMTKNMGIKIRNSLSGNQALEIRINTAIDPTDARAIDLKYHLKCYTKELRKKASRERGQTTSNRDMSIRLAEYMFISLIDSYLCDGAALSLPECERLYVDILGEYGVDATQLRNKNGPHMRKIITDNIHHVKVVNS